MNQTQPPEIKQSRIGVMLLSAILALAYGYALSALLSEPPSLPVSLAVITFALSILMALFAAYSAFRTGQGFLVTFYAVLLIAAVIPALLQARALPATIMLVVVTAAGFFWLFPRNARVLHVSLAAAVLAVIWVVEWLNPAWRQPVGLLQAGPLGAIVFFIIFLALLFRQGVRFSEWNINRKLLTPALVVLALISAGLLINTYYAVSQQYAERERRELEQIQIAALTQIDSANQVAVSLALEAASNPEVQAAFARGDRARLIELMLPVFESARGNFPVKQFVFHSPPATPFLRLQQLDKFGDDLTGIRQTVMDANATKKLVQGIEVGRSGLGVRGVVPVSYRGRHIGVADVGIDIGADFLKRLKTQYNVDAQFLILKQVAEIATFEPENPAGPMGELLLQASTLEQPIYADPASYRHVMAGETATTYHDINKRHYVMLSFPVRDYSNSVIGVFDVMLDRTDVVAAQNRSLFITLLLSALAIFVGAVALTRAVNTITRPITELTDTALAISRGDLKQEAVVRSQDEVGALAGAFNQMVTQLRATLNSLESRVAERTRNLELAAEVGRSVSQARNMDVMLKDAAELIRSRFNLYYAQVYLLNPSKTALTLAAGTGSVGTELLQRKHQLPIDTNSINGRAVVSRQAVVISDVLKSVGFKPNPSLPDTRSEMTIPLFVGDQIVGVLDLQSAAPNAFEADALPAFETLAAQITITIQNTKFLQDVRQSQDELQKQSRQQARRDWREYLNAIHKPETVGFSFDQSEVRPLEGEEAAEGISAPITVGGEALGSLVAQMQGQSPLSKPEELVKAVAERVAQHLEALRLLDMAERYRIESEEASRRLTREGWQQFGRGTDDLRYLYDLKEVRPLRQAEDLPQDSLSIPLKVRDQAIGALAVQGLDETDSHALELATAVAERLSAHIESLRQFEATQRSQVELDRRAQQLATVAEVSTLSAQELDVEKMLQSVVDLTQRKFNLYHAHVFTFNERSQSLEIQACGWQEGDEREGTHGTTAISLLQEQSLVARAARARQPVIVNDVRNEPGWLPNPQLPDTAAELAVPMLVGDKLLGVLDVQSAHKDAFKQEDADIQVTLASQVATALQNALTFAKSQEQAERESKLNLISQKIQGATSVEAVLQIAARELGHALGAPMTIAQLSMKDND